MSNGEHSERTRSIMIERPSIFPASVLAGQTLANRALFPPNGLSLSYRAGRPPEEVQHHRRCLAARLGVQERALVFQSQVHGTAVRIVKASGPAGESDGLVTRTPGLVLCVSLADCAAVLLCDPQGSCVAGLHSGWRGTAANIVAAGIRSFTSISDSKPEELLAYIGACASGQRYEVGAEVAEQFPSSVRRKGKQPQAWLLDIRARIVEQLLAAGLRENAIELAAGCTIGDQRYHSYRRDGPQSGRMAAFIGIIPAQNAT